jgi:Protein of unknown function (DUF3185)
MQVGAVENPQIQRLVHSAKAVSSFLALCLRLARPKMAVVFLAVNNQPLTHVRDTWHPECVLMGRDIDHAVQNGLTTHPQPITPMTKIPSIALLSVGIILLVYGLDASNSLSSSVTQAVNGAPTNKSIWLLALGIIGIISGGFGLFFRRSP